MDLKTENVNIIIVGLGYVGLPLAIAFGKKYTTFGVDINTQRIAELKKGIDSTREVSSLEIDAAQYLQFFSSIENLNFESARRTIFIVTVPTSIDTNKQPDLRPIKSASRGIGKVLQRDGYSYLRKHGFSGMYGRRMRTGVGRGFGSYI